jgi:uncharacterized coiled-coil protein SlyX
LAKQTVYAGEWYPSEDAAKKLDVSIRTLQKWAEKGYLKFRTVRQGNLRPRLYDAADVDRLKESGPPKPRTATRQTENGAEEGNAQTGRVRRHGSEAKLAQALDTVSIVGQMIAGQKAELENRRAELSALVGQLADFAKSSQDAERQRRKDELTDARERWEAERKDARERFEWERKAQEAEREFAALERMRASLRQVDWLSPHECYVLKGLPGKAAKQFAEEGKLDGVRVGKTWRIRRASLEEFRG